MATNPTDALRAAINDWKAKFERVRWEHWDRLPDEDRKNAAGHGADSYITGVISYPFVNRPRDCSLSLFEIGIALWVSEGDFYEAALRLRLSPERLETAICKVPAFKKHVPNSKQKKQDAGVPLVEVVPRDVGVNFDIRLTGVSRRHNYSIGSRIEGDTIVITVDRMLTPEQQHRQRRMIERAEEISKEGNRD